MLENENASEPRKKRLGGCMISFIVILSLLGTAIAGIAWLIFRTPQGKQTIGFARASAQMMMRAAQAPGTSDLKKTLCRDAALVLDLDEFHELQKLLQAPQGPSHAHVQVICDPGNASPVPACDDVARTWLKAVGSTRGDFEAVVKVGATKIHCARVYSSTGEYIGEGHANP